MNSRQRIRTIISGNAADRCGFWMGNPHSQTWPIYHSFFGTAPEEELRRKLGDDLRWIPAGTYRDPGGRWLFAVEGRHSLSAAGPFANAISVADLDRYEWPRLEYLDFAPELEALRNAGDVYRASGMWTPFFHNVMDLFGIESYLMNMCENPEIVHAVTDRVCEFYYEANERFFRQAGDLVDGFFFGNDFGTQFDLICRPDQMEEFILPWFRRFTEQGHRHGYQVILHSCGSVIRVIDRLIECGIDCLHPLQARAEGMDADNLASRFRGRLSFLGGIDTQQLLVHGSPDDIRAEVRRVREALGPCTIISPSHEALLPNVPPANVEAMARETVGNS